MSTDQPRPAAAPATAPATAQSIAQSIAPAAQPAAGHGDAYARAIQDSLIALEERIQAACRRAGRPRQSLRLLAVSKFNPPEAVAAAWQAGQRLFGENRVQEAAGKFGPFGPDGQRLPPPAPEGGAAAAPRLPGAELHLLGHLQSNKARKAVQLFDCVQSADSLDILAELSRQAVKAGRRLDVLLELHTGEESKSGFPDQDSLLAALEAALSLPGLRPRGVMTMAPFTDDEAAIRRSFAACRTAFERAASRLRPADWDVLSMGMTNDFELAIAEGSTLLRVGTAIFGRRQP